MVTFSITYIFHILTTLAGLASSIFILKKDAKYLGNRFMASATGLMGIYTFCIFIYDIFANEALTLILLPIGMVCVLIGTMFIYFAMQCMVNSVVSFKNHKIWIFYAIIVGTIGLVFIIFANQFISFEEPDELGGNINVHLSLYALLVIASLMLYFMFRSIIYLYRHGIKKTEGARKKKMIIFASGLGICIVSLFINAGSQFASGVILDVLTYLVLSFGVSITSYGFLKRV